MKITKIADHKWIIEDEDGNIYGTCRSKKACEGHPAYVNSLHTKALFDQVAEEKAKELTQPTQEDVETAVANGFFKGCEVILPEEKKTGKKEERKQMLNFLKLQITQRIFTRKELLEHTLENFPQFSKSAIDTILSDCKNPKYNPFDAPVVTKNNLYVFER